MMMKVLFINLLLALSFVSSYAADHGGKIRGAGGKRQLTDEQKKKLLSLLLSSSNKNSDKKPNADAARDLLFFDLIPDLGDLIPDLDLGDFIPTLDDILSIDLSGPDCDFTIDFPSLKLTCTTEDPLCVSVFCGAPKITLDIDPLGILTGADSKVTIGLSGVSVLGIDIPFADLEFDFVIPIQDLLPLIIDLITGGADIPFLDSLAEYLPSTGGNFTADDVEGQKCSLSVGLNNIEPKMEPCACTMCRTAKNQPGMKLTCAPIQGMLGNVLPDVFTTDGFSTNGCAAIEFGEVVEEVVEPEPAADVTETATP